LFLQEKGIGIINASPIGMGLLSNRGPPLWHPATQEIKDACAKASTYCKVLTNILKPIMLTFPYSVNTVFNIFLVIFCVLFKKMEKNLAHHLISHWVI
jgi:hypothetical protein